MAEISLEGMSPEAVQGLALLAKGLSEDPKTRTRMLQLAKERDPSMSIPEIDLPAQFNTALEEERVARKKIEDEMRDERTRQQIIQRRGDIAKKGISESEIPEVEKLMTERGIVNHETAADFYLAQKKMAEPTPPPGMPYVPLELPKFDLKKGNIRNQAKGIAAEILQGFRTGKIAA